MAGAPVSDNPAAEAKTQTEAEDEEFLAIFLGKSVSLVRAPEATIHMRTAIADGRCQGCDVAVHPEAGLLIGLLKRDRNSRGFSPRRRSLAGDGSLHVCIVPTATRRVSSPEFSNY
jgi:hypothetical protein